MERLRRGTGKDEGGGETRGNMMERLRRSTGRGRMRNPRGTEQNGAGKRGLENVIGGDRDFVTGKKGEDGKIHEQRTGAPGKGR